MIQYPNIFLGIYMKINQLHKLKQKIDIEYYFDNHYINKSFFEDNDFFITLKETKCKNFQKACEDDRFICVKSYIKKSSYTIPSAFIRKEDQEKVENLIKQEFLKPELESVSKPEETLILFIIEKVKEKNISFYPFKTRIIDFVVDNDYTKKSFENDLKFVPNGLDNLINGKFTIQSVSDFMSAKFKKKDQINKEKRRLHQEAEAKRIAKIKKEQEEQNKIKELKKSERIDCFNQWSKDNGMDHLIQEFKTLFLNVFGLNGFDCYLAHVDLKINTEHPDYFSLHNNTLSVSKKRKATLFSIMDKLKSNIELLKDFDGDFAGLSVHKIGAFSKQLNHPFNVGGGFKKAQKKQFKNRDFLNLSKERELLIEKSFYLSNEPFYFIINKELKLKLNIRNTKEIIDQYGSKDPREWSNNRTNIFDMINKVIVDLKSIEQLYLSKIKESPVIQEHNISIESDKVFDFIFENSKNKKKEINISITEFSAILESQTIGDHLNKAINKSIEESFSKSDFYEAIIQYDMSKLEYKELYPEARERNREILYFSGPTNSGKSYQAFEELKKAKSGVYLAPLRLLALEGQEEIEKRGFSCSLLTGEEQDINDDAQFVSSTIEMVDLTKEYDVAIIDEIQMLKDSQRGDAWLQAFAGVNAKKVIVIGSEDIRMEVKNLAKYFEEPIKERVFVRKNELLCNRDILIEIQEKKSLDKGTAIIVFSKKDIELLSMKLSDKGYSVSKIYGALPPKIRRYEAERFKNGETEILVTTDAIGMGLNLPIKTVIFYAKEKYNGYETSNLEATLVKQIAGRAGRFGYSNEAGQVIGANKDIHQHIEKSLKKQTNIYSVSYKCKPIYSIIDKIREVYNTEDIKKIFDIYEKTITLDRNITGTVSEMESTLAESLSQQKQLMNEAFGFKEKFKITKAPIKEYLANKYFNIVSDLASYRIGKRRFKPLSAYFESMFKNNRSQSTMEEESDFLDLLSYLAYRFDEYIEDIEFIEKEKELLYQSWMDSIKSNQHSGKKMKFELQGKPKQKRYYNNYHYDYDDYFHY